MSPSSHTRFLLFVSLFLIGCDRSTQPPTTEGPVGGLSVLPARHELGDVPNDSTSRVMTVATRLRNDGRQPITIEELRSSCSCSVVRLDQQTLAPGDEAILTTNITVGHSPEPQQSAVTIVARHAERRHRRTVTFSWRAVNPIWTEPKRCAFDQRLESTDSVTQELTLFGRDGFLCEDCQFTLDRSSPLIGTSLRGDILNPSAARHSGTRNPAQPVELGTLAVTVEGTRSSQVHQENIRLNIVCEGQPRARLDIPVVWTTEPAFEILPAALTLGVQPPGATLTKTALITSTDGTEFELKRVEASDPRSHVQTRFERRSATDHRVTIQVALPEEPGPWRDVISMETGGARPRTLELPISAIIPEPHDEASPTNTRRTDAD